MRRRGGLVPLAGLIFPLVVAACGVPISASEITATVENGGSSAVLALYVEPIATQASSRSQATPAPSLTTPAQASTTPTPMQAATRLSVSATPTAAASGTPGRAPTTVSTGVATANAGFAASTATVTGTPGTTTPTVTGTPPTPTATSTPAVAAASLAGLANDALTALNAERTRQGLRTVTANAQLASAAANYAQYMAQANFFGHDGPDGSSPSSRTAKAGYTGQWRGETLAAGQTSGAAVIQVWLNSPPHRVIILDPGIREVGIGHYFDAGDVYGHYWALEAGVP